MVQTVKNQSAMVWIPGWSSGEGYLWLPIQVFLPRELHGQRGLVDYSSWGHKESDTTEQLAQSLIIY